MAIYKWSIIIITIIILKRKNASAQKKAHKSFFQRFQIANSVIFL